MVTKRRWWIALSLRLGLLAVVAAAVLTIGSTLQAQVVDGSVVAAVGGISINPNGASNKCSIWTSSVTRYGSGPRAVLDKIPAVLGEADEPPPRFRCGLREAAVEEIATSGCPQAPQVPRRFAADPATTCWSIPIRKTSCWLGPAKAGKSNPAAATSSASPPSAGAPAGRPVG